jgi:hypothetical protein
MDSTEITVAEKAFNDARATAIKTLSRHADVWELFIDTCERSPLESERSFAVSADRFINRLPRASQTLGTPIDMAILTQLDETVRAVIKARQVELEILMESGRLTIDFVESQNGKYGDCISFWESFAKVLTAYNLMGRDPAADG